MTPSQHDIYLDGNATSPVLPAAREAAVAAMDTLFGNPSSTHGTGVRAKALMDGVRACAQRVLGVGEGQLAFMSGATEGIQTAVLSALCDIKTKQARGLPTGRLLVYGATEHKAVPESLTHWNEILGLHLELRALPVDGNGRHDLLLLSQWLADTAMLCTMAANNETGVVSDIPGIERLLVDSNSKALWMVDCVQALGKLDLALSQTRIDYAPFSGHKLYAPKGIGMLYVRSSAPFTPLMKGGGQEEGLRAGTENTVGIAALGAVLNALETGHTFCTHAQLVRSRDRLAASLIEAFPGLVFNTPFAYALPTTLNFSVPGLSSKELLDLFDAARVRVSAGSACSAAKSQPSYVLEAMGLPQWRTTSAVRMSFGPIVEDAFINEACQRIAHCGAIAQSMGQLTLTNNAQAPLQLLQFRADAASSWLLLDNARKRCIAIALHDATLTSISNWLARQAFVLEAVLSTAAEDARCAQTLRAQAQTNGTRHGSVEREFAGHTLTSFATPAGWAYFLTPQSATLGTRYLFLNEGHELAPLLGSTNFREAQADAHHGPTTVCLSLDPECIFIAAAFAEEHAQTPALASTTQDSATLLGTEVSAFLKANPRAQLVDVRESFEFAASERVDGNSLGAINVPLSQLTGYAHHWLEDTGAPLVFVCRGGNRSAKALETLQRMGHPCVMHIPGGVTLGQIS
ncbi:aminotransferase class V-fold PLP-dependent enzyme [Rhodoferax aquaticus]|uniref:cysteine desulfurase n=1 Tax=Rhodoferax aquaticus TaxID=2527691 RepID=A0A515EMK4_9BURK|nr:aminotransferase class V-fold PLP-dependent enzyme [Rhodoferax aquaticus]QDL53889.1 aminotransferase class V-fold PLP-dependent enzyme [Rhodoferax aquaticus]